MIRLFVSYGSWSRVRSVGSTGFASDATRCSIGKPVSRLRSLSIAIIVGVASAVVWWLTNAGTEVGAVGFGR